MKVPTWTTVRPARSDQTWMDVDNGQEQEHHEFAVWFGDCVHIDAAATANRREVVMDLEDAYGWLAVPAKILEASENVLSDIGVPVGPWVAQLIVLIVAASLAAAFAIWFFRTEQRGPPRFAILVVALGTLAIFLPIPTFWIQFLIDPPKGEIVGSISGVDAANWRIAVIDNRGARIADATVSDTQGLFTAYYTPTLGQFPARIEASRQGCASRSAALGRDFVFGDRMLELELTCQPPSE